MRVYNENSGIWGRENPNLTKMLHFIKQRVVWCALSVVGILGPVLLEENANSEHYGALLEENFIPSFQGMGCDVNGFFSTRWGMTTH
jgi:hypothetical protein